MIALLYALLIGSIAAVIGGSGGDSEPETTTPESDGAPQPSSPFADTSDDEEDDDGDDGGQGIGSDGPGSGFGGSGSSDLPDDAFDIGWAGLSAEEQLIVELVNRARMDPLAEVDRLNEGLASGISRNPVEPLAVTPELSQASEDHSEDMDNRNFFDHTNPDNDTPSDRAIEAGHGSRFVGENIGWVGSTRAPDIQNRAEGHHENLWESDGHQRNLMDDDWSEIGVGYDYGSLNGYNHSTFVTEMFGDRGETYLTGVVIDDADGDRFYDIGEGQGDVEITAYSGDDVFATATWDAGGYSLALPAGTYRVVFEGGDLDGRYETDVTIGTENVKLDIIEGDTTRVATLNAAVVPDAGPEADILAALSLPEVDQAAPFGDAQPEEFDSMMLG